MTQKNEGSCQCGAVKFQISGPFESFFLCHCSRCRKDTGSAHAANLFSTVAKITWLSGEDRIKTYRVPESRHEKSFCSECGSAVPGIQMDGALLVVPAGSLDTPVDIRPNAHICLSSRANWDDGLDEVTRLEGLPG
ncbi:GFA family protein [Nitratireductor aquimarinus]|uniref:GFA family protein n=1 Tax=Nitratireductor TaxID=245876 RepID=UPI001A8BF84D|nr:GFA family protein [Nitratireductor aquimarinus]MBN8243164.1 GFA family protein [Nitratireductor aquimarinus]MBY6131065.1 GFA family protein [Nitratireductor aquimarinus]MCA1302179.1 GFA family protein [Nitratireductor aquimarinus]MDV2966756.1 GFA family protein [Nitratireductor aquimarinus]